MAEYTIIREIGHGGMGCVYEAQNDEGHRIALKKLDCRFAGNQEYRNFFEAEVASLKAMSHPDIVKIAGEAFPDDDGNLYLPMEFVEGETVEQRVRKTGPLSEDYATSLMGKILTVFAYLHGKDCIHRDIKPANIMIRPDDSVCIIDFGIAKDMKTHTGQTIGRIVGTDGYMSPEQAKGDSIDSRTDIYSLGCLYYFMLAGQHAITKKGDFETMKAILNEEFPHVRDVNPTVSAEAEAIILKATNKNMLYRFQTAEKFHEALDAGLTVPTTVLPRIVVTLGRNRDCDIVFPAHYSYISGQHLEIEFCEGVQPELLIIDHSTNGTSIEGRKLHHDQMHIPCASCLSKMPAIYLAAKTEGKVNWQEVKDKIQAKGGWKELPKTPLPPPAPGPNPDPNLGLSRSGCRKYLITLLIILSSLVLYITNI